jgi:hypothetical protein
MPDAPKKPAPPLYRRHFTAVERRDLDAHEAPGLLSEINLMRVILSRNFAEAAPPPEDFHAHRFALTSRAWAASLIASLLRTQLTLSNPMDELRAEIEEGIRLFREEEGL